MRENFLVHPSFVAWETPRGIEAPMGRETRVAQHIAEGTTVQVSEKPRKSIWTQT